MGIDNIKPPRLSALFRCVSRSAWRRKVGNPTLKVGVQCVAGNRWHMKWSDKEVMSRLGPALPRLAPSCPASPCGKRKRYVLKDSTIRKSARWPRCRKVSSWFVEPHPASGIGGCPTSVRINSKVYPRISGLSCVAGIFLYGSYFFSCNIITIKVWIINFIFNEKFGKLVFHNQTVFRRAVVMCSNILGKNKTFMIGLLSSLAAQLATAGSLPLFYCVVKAVN